MGDELVPIQSKETGKGAVVQLVRATNLPSEIWPMVDDPPGVGPCTDAVMGADPLVGRGTFVANDNDVFGSGTRGNAYGGRGQIRAEGHRYTWRFHVNSRCYAPDEEPPRCEVVRSSFR